jgi:hypothetical protein
MGNALTIFVWDDHEIFDGFGSYPPELQNCPTFQGAYHQARWTYLLFQHHVTTEYLETLPSTTLPPSPLILQNPNSTLATPSTPHTISAESRYLRSMREAREPSFRSCLQHRISRCRKLSSRYLNTVNI